MGNECSGEKSTLVLSCLLKPLVYYGVELLGPLVYQCLEVFVVVQTIGDE